MEWNHITSSRPVGSEVVLVSDGLQITMAWQADMGRWLQINTWDSLPNITHWMPLPKPPEEQEQRT